MSLNLASAFCFSASVLPVCRSGWNLRASARYAFFTSAQSVRQEVVGADVEQVARCRTAFGKVEGVAVAHGAACTVEFGGGSLSS